MFTIDKALGGHNPLIFKIDCGLGDVGGSLENPKGARAANTREVRVIVSPMFTIMRVLHRIKP